MSKFICNSCGGTYSDTLPDGTNYFHTCPSEVIQPATFDDAGKVVTAEKRTPRANIRNENLAPGVYYSEGKAVRRVPNPEERGMFLEVPGEVAIISEGKGRTQIE